MSVIISSTKSGFPALPFEAMKNDILGRSYQLSLSFVGETRGRRLNQETRGKSYVPNVLSFPLSESAGEIYITGAVAKREAHKWDHTYKEHVAFLFIHGLLHLKGHDHGEEMEKLEARWLKKYRNKTT